jgi:hypothetical protein
VWNGFCLRPYSACENLYLTRFTAYKIARPPQRKIWEGRGGDLRQINTCRKVHVQVNFLRRRHFALLSIWLISRDQKCLRSIKSPLNRRVSRDGFFRIWMVSDCFNSFLLPWYLMIYFLFASVKSHPNPFPVVFLDECRSTTWFNVGTLLL